jgi:hypothetical protein
MGKLTRGLAWLALACLMAGCTTPTITNLTPSRLSRKPNDQYPFAVEYYTRQATLVRDSMKAYVIIGNEKYLMERIPMLTNRFETLVPIPAGQDTVTYRYRFEYDYRGIPDVQSASQDSKYYQLLLLNP